MSLPARVTDEISESIPDEDIVQHVLDGDIDSFELIMRKYNQRLFRVARSIIGEDSEAEDIVQEAYVRAYEHLDQFAGRAQFATWLTKIAVYEATARRRKLRRLRLATPNAADERIMEFESTNLDPSDDACQNELRGLLADAIDALPEDLRVVVALRMIERLSTIQTAECLGITPGNVKTRLHRARLAMQAWIDTRIGQEIRHLYEFDGVRCDRIVDRVMARISAGS